MITWSGDEWIGWTAAYPAVTHRSLLLPQSNSNMQYVCFSLSSFPLCSILFYAYIRTTPT